MDYATGERRSLKKQSWACVLSEMVFLWAYFHGISQHPLWSLILPPGCNFFCAISVIYLLSYPSFVSCCFIVSSGSVSHDWAQPRDKTLKHIFSPSQGWPSQCSWLRCYPSQLAIACLNGISEWETIIISNFQKIKKLFSCKNVLSYPVFFVVVWPLPETCKKFLNARKISSIEEEIYKHFYFKKASQLKDLLLVIIFM